MTGKFLACYGNAARQEPSVSSGCTNPENLASDVIGKTAGFPTGSGYVDIAFPAATTVRGLALNGVVLRAGATHTARFDLSRWYRGGTDVLTTTKTLAPPDGYGGLCAWDLGQDYPGVVYLRVTVTGVSEVGLVWASPAWVLAYSPSSYSEQRKDLSTVTAGELSGIQTSAQRGRQRVGTFGCTGRAQAEYNYADTLDLVTGTTNQVLFIWAPPLLGPDRGPIMGTLKQVPTMTLRNSLKFDTAYEVTQSL